MARIASCSPECRRKLRSRRRAHGVGIRVSFLYTILTWYSLVIPFGRFGALKKDIELSGKRKSEGGNGRAEEFWEWSEKQVQQYL